MTTGSRARRTASHTRRSPRWSCCRWRSSAAPPRSASHWCSTSWRSPPSCGSSSGRNFVATAGSAGPWPRVRWPCSNRCATPSASVRSTYCCWPSCSPTPGCCPPGAGAWRASASAWRRQSSSRPRSSSACCCSPGSGGPLPSRPPSPWAPPRSPSVRYRTPPASTGRTPSGTPPAWAASTMSPTSPCRASSPASWHRPNRAVPPGSWPSSWSWRCGCGARTGRCGQVTGGPPSRSPASPPAWSARSRGCTISCGCCRRSPCSCTRDGCGSRVPCTWCCAAVWCGCGSTTRPGSTVSSAATPTCGSPSGCCSGCRPVSRG